MSLFEDSPETYEIITKTPGGFMNYNVERTCFKHLKANINDEAKAEYELGIENLIERYNTSIYENRFIVGGIVEIFTLALMRSTGIEVQGCGAEAQGGDLILPTGEMFSIKSSFTKYGNIILINTRGDSNTKWSTATLFILSNIGIVYGDPSMVVEDDLKRVKDSLEITRAALRRFAEDPSNRILMNIPLKPPKEKEGTRNQDSVSLARKLMREFKMERLLEQIE